MNTPVGRLTLVANDRALVAILWQDEDRAPFDDATPADDHPILAETERQLGEYFAGRRTTFDLPLEPEGTPFQKKVWQALSQIPFGRTVSYRDIATAVGDPKACRAVGAANGRNPIPIVVPCHRVIGASGKLTGFGGGLENKSLLLALESPEPPLIAAATSRGR
jgi:methylated-DNA-[protein]-cysteine S-methyltransferase